MDPTTADDVPLGAKIAIGIYCVVFWFGVLWWMRRRNLREPDRPRTVSAGFIPFLYLLSLALPWLQMVNAEMEQAKRERELRRREKRRLLTFRR